MAFGSSSVTTYGTATNTVVTAPTGISDGDDLFIQFFILNGSGTPPTPTPPAGFTLVPIAKQSQTSFGATADIYLWHKKASGESGNYTITHTSASTQALMVRYTGNHPSTPINAFSSNAESPDNTVRTATGVTTTVANCTLVEFGWDWADNTTDESPPTGMTERVDNVLSYLCDVVQVAAGASGDKTNFCNSFSGAPRGAYLVALAPAPSGTTITAAAGSYTVTGTAAGVNRGRAVAANIGSYVLTGSVVTLTAASGNKAIAADAGSFTLTGTTTQLEFGRVVTAAQGSFLLTGSDVTLKYGKQVVAAAGAYNFIGDTVTVGKGLIVAGGIYTLTGSNVSLEFGYKVPAAAGSFVLTGSSVLLNSTLNLTANVGDFVLTGSNVDLQVSKRLALGSDGFLLTGTNVEVLRGRNLSAEGGTFAFVGTDATLLLSLGNHYAIGADTGSFDLTGTATQFSRGYNVEAFAGSYQMFGANVNLFMGIDVSDVTGVIRPYAREVTRNPLRYVLNR